MKIFLLRLLKKKNLLVSVLDVNITNSKIIQNINILFQNVIIATSPFESKSKQSAVTVQVWPRPTDYMNTEVKTVLSLTLPYLFLCTLVQTLRSLSYSALHLPSIQNK